MSNSYFFKPVDQLTFADNWMFQAVLRDKAGISQSTASHYLDMLQKAGLLLSERHGKWTYYRRNEETLAALADYFGHEI